MKSEQSPLSRFTFYVGEGVHYLKEDLKGALVTLFGRGKVQEPEPEPEPEIPVVSPAEILERIEVLQEALQGQQVESSAFEQQLNNLKQMVRISQHQQQQIAQELSILSEVLHRQ